MILAFFTVIFGLFGAPAQAALQSPSYPMQINNYSQKKFVLKVTISCDIYTPSGDGDYWETPCRKYDAERGGIDPAQKHLPDVKRVTLTPDSKGRVTMPSLEVYTSIHGKGETILWITVNSDDGFGHKVFAAKGPMDIWKTQWNYNHISIYDFAEQRFPFKIRDDHGRSEDEFLALFPADSVRGTAHISDINGNALVAGGSANNVAKDKVFRTWAWTVVVPGNWPAEIILPVYFQLSLTNTLTITAFGSMSNVRGIVTVPEFQTSNLPAKK